MDETMGLDTCDLSFLGFPVTRVFTHIFPRCHRGTFEIFFGVEHSARTEELEQFDKEAKRKISSQDHTRRSLSW